MCYIDYTSIDLSKASLDDGQWEWIKASITAATTPYVMRDERGYYWCHAEEAAKAMDFVVIALGHKPASSEAEFEKSMANGKKLRYEQFSKTVSEAAAKIGADPEIVWKLLNGGISDVRALFRWAEAEEFTALHFHGK